MLTRLFYVIEVIATLMAIGCVLGYFFHSIQQEEALISLALVVITKVVSFILIGGQAANIFKRARF